MSTPKPSQEELVAAHRAAVGELKQMETYMEIMRHYPEWRDPLQVNVQETDDSGFTQEVIPGRPTIQPQGPPEDYGVISNDWNRKAPYNLRRCLFTLNNPTKEEVEMISKLDCYYMIWQFEVAPSTNTLHIQGFVKFESAVTFKWLKEAMGGRVHLDKCQCRVDAPIIAYCSKSEADCKPGMKYAGKGGRCPNTMPFIKGTSGDKAGQGKSNALLETVAEIKANPRIDMKALMDTKPELMARNGRFIERYRDECIQQEPLVTDRKCTILFGPGGIGKSESVIQQHGGIDNVYIKGPFDWDWPKYKGEKVVIIDEFEGYDPRTRVGIPLAVLNKFMDRYKSVGNVKYSYAYLNVEFIYIITNAESVKELFPTVSDVKLKTFERRLNQVWYKVDPVTGNGKVAKYTPCPPRVEKRIPLPGSSDFDAQLAALQDRYAGTIEAISNRTLG